MDGELLFFVLGILLAIIGYYKYIKDIFGGKTKPHIFSWFIFVIITFTGFFIQLWDKGGLGSWITGLTGVIFLVVFLLGIKFGEKNITKSDIVSFLGALFAIAVWYYTKNPFYSLLLIIVIHFFGMYPTIRKSIVKPLEETAITYILAGIRSIFAVLALENFTVLTYGYPLFLIILNIGFGIFLLIKRKQLGK